MQFGSPALDACDEVQAYRIRAEMAIKRVALRDRRSQVLPPESRDDLADVLDCLHEMYLLMREEVRPAIQSEYLQRIGKKP